MPFKPDTYRLLFGAQAELYKQLFLRMIFGLHVQFRSENTDMFNLFTKML